MKCMTIAREAVQVNESTQRLYLIESYIIMENVYLSEGSKQVLRKSGPNVVIFKKSHCLRGL